MTTIPAPYQGNVASSSSSKYQPFPSALISDSCEAALAPPTYCPPDLSCDPAAAYADPLLEPTSSFQLPRGYVTSKSLDELLNKPHTKTTRLDHLVAWHPNRVDRRHHPYRTQSKASVRLCGFCFSLNCDIYYDFLWMYYGRNLCCYAASL